MTQRNTPERADIVERLRASADHWCTDTSLSREMADMEREAADEIERLRSVIRDAHASTDPAWTAQIIERAITSWPVVAGRA